LILKKRLGFSGIKTKKIGISLSLKTGRQRSPSWSDFLKQPSFCFKNQSCATNPDMFDWFNIGKRQEIGSIPQIEAGMVIYHRNFLNALIMKAWIQCALDVNCMANGCLYCKCCDPGCHRFDQSALTMVLSFFFQYPNYEKHVAAHNISPNNSVSTVPFFREYYNLGTYPKKANNIVLLVIVTIFFISVLLIFFCFKFNIFDFKYRIMPYIVKMKKWILSRYSELINPVMTDVTDKTRYESG
jgi:hypothetical protein